MVVLDRASQSLELEGSSYRFFLHTISHQRTICILIVQLNGFDSKEDVPLVLDETFSKNLPLSKTVSKLTSTLKALHLNGVKTITNKQMKSFSLQSYIRLRRDFNPDFLKTYSLIQWYTFGLPNRQLKATRLFTRHCLIKLSRTRPTQVNVFILCRSLGISIPRPLPD